MKFTRKIFFLLSCIGILFTGCFFVSFENITVSCNISESVDFFDEDFIQFEFSISPEHDAFEEGVQLTEDSSSVTCDFQWENNICKIFPHEKWNYGSFYSLSISKDLKMEDGRTYSVNVYRAFYYGQKDKYLKLESCSVTDNSFINVDDNIVFTFNYSVDILSFKDNFTMTPSNTFDFRFSNENKTVTVIPTNEWKTNSYYVWELSKIKSKEQYPLDRKYTGSFYAPCDIIQPELVSIHPVLVDSTSKTWNRNRTLSDLYVYESIGFIFSESIDFDSLKEAITFSPSLSGTFVQYDKEGKEFIYCIEKNWSSDTEYQLKITTALNDSNQMPLYEEYQAFFTPKVDLTEITSIALNDKIITDYSEKENICTLSVEDGEKVVVKIIFSKNIEDEYKESAYNLISVNSFFPSSAISPAVLQVLWNSDSELEITYKGFTKSESNKNYYVLKIAGGNKNILNDSNSYIPESVCVYFTVVQE